MPTLESMAEILSRRRSFWPRLRVRPGTALHRQIIVATAGRVGSTWACKLLTACGVKPGLWMMPSRYLQANGTFIVDARSLAWLEGATFLTWFKSHSLPPEGFDPSAHPTVRFVTVLRDPRDVLVSAADYLTWLDTSLGGGGAEFASLPESERILRLIEEGDWFLRALERWQAWPHAVRIYYEDMVRDPEAALAALLAGCDIEPRAGAVARAVRRNDFAATAGRRAGVEEKGSFLRKGVSGDWRDKFDARCLRRFAEAKNGRWLRLAEAIAARASPSTPARLNADAGSAGLAEAKDGAGRPRFSASSDWTAVRSPRS